MIIVRSPEARSQKQPLRTNGGTAWKGAPTRVSLLGEVRCDGEAPGERGLPIRWRCARTSASLVERSHFHWWGGETGARSRQVLSAWRTDCLTDNTVCVVYGQTSDTSEYEETRTWAATLAVPPSSPRGQVLYLVTEHLGISVPSSLMSTKLHFRLHRKLGQRIQQGYAVSRSENIYRRIELLTDARHVVVKCYIVAHIFLMFYLFICLFYFIYLTQK